MQGLDFDDILLVPRASTVNSRSEVNTSVNLGKGLELDIPIIASPMKGITGVNLVKEIATLGGIGILHRFHNKDSDFYADLESLQGTNFGVAVGLRDYVSENRGVKVKESLKCGAKIICLDIANGYLETALRCVESIAGYISQHTYEALVMAGNIATAEGARNLGLSGADLIRVGIGSGNLCTTRNVTGVGMPQLTALELTSSINDRDHYYGEIDPIIIADGGIRNSGDAVKALVFGADAVMLGSLLATTYESSNNGIIYGMASRRLQEDYYHSVKSVEGIERQVTPKQSLAEFIDEFVWGIESACTYLNASKLKQLRGVEYIHVGTGSIKKIGT